MVVLGPSRQLPGEYINFTMMQLSKSFPIIYSPYHLITQCYIVSLLAVLQNSPLPPNQDHIPRIQILLGACIHSKLSVFCYCEYAHILQYNCYSVMLCLSASIVPTYMDENESCYSLHEHVTYICHIRTCCLTVPYIVLPAKAVIRNRRHIRSFHN
jgi:hypothetical protein